MVLQCRQCYLEIMNDPSMSEQGAYTCHTKQVPLLYRHVTVSRSRNILIVSSIESHHHNDLILEYSQLQVSKNQYPMILCVSNQYDLIIIDV